MQLSRVVGWKTSNSMRNANVIWYTYIYRDMVWRGNAAPTIMICVRTYSIHCSNGVRQSSPVILRHQTPSPLDARLISICIGSGRGKGGGVSQKSVNRLKAIITISVRAAKCSTSSTVENLGPKIEAIQIKICGVWGRRVRGRHSPIDGKSPAGPFTKKGRWIENDITRG